MITTLYETELEDGTPVEVFIEIDSDSNSVIINEINVDGEVFYEDDFKEEHGKKTFKKILSEIENHCL